MDTILWHLSTSAGVELLAPLWRPLLVGFALYYSSYLFIAMRLLALRAGLRRFVPLAAHEQPDALVVMPTLLRNRDELRGLQRAVTSVLQNGYPGDVAVWAAIDDGSVAPALCEELVRWAAQLALPPSQTVAVSIRPDRGGKAMAIEHAMVQLRANDEPLPPVLFSMDADSELSAGALERMVAQLLRKRAMIVASNVCVRRDVYWRGWRRAATVRGQLALQVAREYMTSISLARHNSRLIPVSSVSGALYCTWTALYEAAPRYAAFVQQLRGRDWLAWWLGRPPPSFARSRVTPLPEAMTGPGDDTWVAWLAMGARWQRGRITLELPRTPLHALWYALRAYVRRPVAYDPAAQVYTATPTTIRALFRQRVRWNSSRIWLLGRFGWSPLFNWSVGAVIYFDVLVVVGLHAVIVGGLLLWPLADRPAMWLALLVLMNAGYMVLRGSATVLAMLQDGGVRKHAPKLLALPLSGIYHLVFNVATTLVGLVQDVLLFGVNTKFAPEQTLVRAHTGRIAIAFRLRRAFGIAVRAAHTGRIPFGRWWFGWRETRWTPNGYAGWTSPTERKRPR